MWFYIMSSLVSSSTPTNARRLPSLTFPKRWAWCVITVRPIQCKRGEFDFYNINAPFFNFSISIMILHSRFFHCWYIFFLSITERASLCYVSFQLPLLLPLHLLLHLTDDIYSAIILTSHCRPNLSSAKSYKSRIYRTPYQHPPCADTACLTSFGSNITITVTIALAVTLLHPPPCANRT